MLEMIIGAGFGVMAAVALRFGADAYVEWEHSKGNPSQPYRAFLSMWEGMKHGLEWAFSKARITHT